MKSVVNVGLLGFGTVGSGAYQTLVDNREAIGRKVGAEVRVKRIAVAHPDRPRAAPVERGMLTGDPYEIITDPEIDIVCELIGGVEPAGAYIRQAFAHGKHVVSANKELLAKHGASVIAEAETRHLDFFFEGAVAGGIPIIRPLMTSLAGNRIERIEGIVNGTTNYILTKMAVEGRDFAEVLADAQRLGYAEADPSSDVDGWDAAYKMCILAGIGFGAAANLDDVRPEGISHITERDLEYAKELGYTIKLLGIAKRRDERIEVRVHPAMLPAHHPLAHVDDVFNAVLVSGSSVGDVMFYGRGAGALPTGSAVAGDVVEIARNLVTGATGSHPRLDFAPVPLLPLDDVVCSFYIRMQVPDRPRALAAVAGVLGDHDVSISSVVQKIAEPQRAEIVWVTHPVREAQVRAALSRIVEEEPGTSVVNVIRVEA